MSNRLCDLMRQGFMKPAPKRNKTRTDQERAEELSRLAGVRVTPSSRRGRYAVPHPDGHDNHVTYSEAVKLIRNMAMGE